jgi:hypothetical protein
MHVLLYESMVRHGTEATREDTLHWYTIGSALRLGAVPSHGSAVHPSHAGMNGAMANGAACQGV